MNKVLVKSNNLENEKVGAKRLSSDVILTGVTGILGSHVLYELLAMKMRGEFDGKIITLVRSNDKSAKQRVLRLLQVNCTPAYLHSYDTAALEECLEIIDCDLKQMDSAIGKIKSITRKSTIIHSGSSVNLGTDQGAEKEVYENNYKATLNLLNQLVDITEHFVFISTAFASGHREGEINDNFLYMKGKKFRNHYEKYKAMTEHKITSLCEANGIKWQILRPSVICGRLIDDNKYFIPKHLVFYLIGDFFFRMAKKFSQGQPPIRILLKKDASVNIVPVDYVAKTVLKAVEVGFPTELNIVSKQNMSVVEMYKYILDKTGYNNYSIVSEIPDDQNDVEKFYYKWIGSQMNHYIDTPVHHYNVSKLRQLVPDIEDPAAANHFNKIFDYAYANAFKNISA